MTEPERIRTLNERDERDGAYVLYWMQQSQRASFNPALEVAIREANARSLPVVVGFGLMDGYPEANLRHYAFMLQGLAEVEATCQERKLAFVIRRGAPHEVALDLADQAALVVVDRGYLRHQKAWRQRVAEEAACPVVEVEGDVVVPIGLVSHKGETAARTIRPKIHRHWDACLKGLDDAAVQVEATLALNSDIDPSDLEQTLAKLDLDRSVAPVKRFTGGTSAARRQLSAFLRSKFEGYAEGRNEPGAFQCSMLSPYLHFGQISPVEIALKAQAAKSGSGQDEASFLEELIVRRELAMNHVAYTDDYDRYQTLPAWARTTLAEHKDDPRDPAYSQQQLEAADTHDRFWNAAMREMVHTGYMHNYMRMYWAKKILEWTPDPEQAFATALHLNNKYFLDGRDPNSFTNVAWTFGLHDRGWTERAVFGKVRYMNANGLKRKFHMPAYIAAVDQLVAAEAG